MGSGGGSRTPTGGGESGTPTGGIGRSFTGRAGSVSFTGSGTGDGSSSGSDSKTGTMFY